jgi:integrase
MPKRERGQGCITKLSGSRFYYILYYDNSGQQHRESTKSELKSVAQEMLNARLAAMGRGEKSPNVIRSIRYEDMRAILVNHYKENSVGEIVKDGDGKDFPFKRNLKPLDDFFAGMRLDQMDTDVFRAFREHRKKDPKVGDATINRNLSLLRRMMTLTIREKKLQFAKPYFPMTSEVNNVRKGFVTPQQFAKLLEVMPSYLKPYVLFLYELGSRTGAGAEIVWSWVDMKEGVIEIPEGVTKTGEPQTLPMSDELMGLLKKQFRKDGSPVFDTTNFRKEFRNACAAVGLGKLTKVVSERGYRWEKYEGLIPHDFRRSAVRNMIRAKVDVRVAMQISGHKTRSVFDRYNISDTDDVKDAVRKVAEFRKAATRL